MARPLTNALQNFMMSKQARQQEVAQQQQQQRQNQTRELLGQMVMGGDPGNLAQVNPEAFIMGQNYLQQQQQNQATSRQNALVSDLRRQYAETQDPEVLRRLMAVDSEAASKMQEQMGIVDEESRNQAINQATAFSQVVQNNPDQAMEYFNANLANNPAFQGLEDELQAGDYEGVLQGIGVGITALGGQEAYEKFKGESELIETGEGYATWNAARNRFETVDGAPLTPEQVQVQNEQRIAEIEAEAKRAKTDQERADKLREEVGKRSKELGFEKTFAAMNRIANSNDGTPAGDLALIFNYMKMLDPGSVVREGEFATAQNAAGVPARVINTYNNLISGERLNPEQRRNFTDQSQKIYQGAVESFEQSVQPILSIGESTGLTQEEILGEDYFGSFNVDTGGDEGTGAPDSTVVLDNHPIYGTITEADVKTTMRNNNVTREQVMEMLNSGGAK